MKRKSLRTLVCALLASLALTTFAFADSGPKPQLPVRVKDAPQELYYLDLLAEGNWDASEGNSRLKQSTVITNSDGCETTVPLNEDLLALLLDNIPAGWHACTAQGTFGAPIFSHLFSRGTDASGNALHRFGYVGVPSTYRIILVTESGKVWVSDILNHRTQRRERLVFLFLPASGGTHHFACRAVSLRRLRLSHRPQQGPRRGLCDHGQSGFRCPRLLSGRACLAACRLDLMILFT